MIPAREAIILWDSSLQKVMVKPKGQQDTPEMAKLAASGGAAFDFWQEAPASELYFRLMQTFAGIVRDDGIPVDTVHEAFLVIPEYRASLPPCPEREELEDENIEVELPDGWTSGAPI